MYIFLIEILQENVISYDNKKDINIIYFEYGNMRRVFLFYFKVYKTID